MNSAVSIQHSVILRGNLGYNMHRGATDMEAGTSADQLRELERRLMMFGLKTSAEGATLEQCAALMADDFIEIGSSGKRYNKQQALQAMQHSGGVQTRMSDFQVRSLSPDIALVTYRAHKEVNNETVSTLRSSIWKRENHRWKVHYHQGTLASDR